MLLNVNRINMSLSIRIIMLKNVDLGEMLIGSDFFFSSQLRVGNISYTIEENDSYISIDYNEGYQDEYLEEYLEDKDVPQEFKEDFENYSIFNIYYNDNVLLNKLLKHMLFYIKDNIKLIWIDNDSAHIFSGDAVLVNISKDILWNIQDNYTEN